MASQLAEAYVTVSANASQFPGQLAGIKSQLASAIGDMANRFAMTGFVFRRLIDMGKEFALAIAEDEEEVLKFQGAMQAAGRGEYYENMVKQIGEASEATTKFSADSVRAAGTAIARFSTLGDDTLGQVINAAKDLSAQFGGDLTSNATKLAMAMERPEVGMRMLRSMGVNLTAAQAGQIKELMKAGQTSEASMMILQIASGKASGAAERLGGTLMSLWTRMKTELSELSEAMGGKMISGLKAFGEFAIKALRSIRDLIEGDSIVGKIAAMAGSFLGLASAGGTLIQVFSTIKGLLFGTLGPIGWIIAGAVAIGTQFVSLSDIIAWFTSAWEGITKWWQSSTPIIERMKISLAMIKDEIVKLVSGIVQMPDWSSWWKAVQEWIGNAADAVLRFTEQSLEAIVSFVRNIDIWWERLKLSAESAVLEMVGYFQREWPKTTAVIVALATVIKTVMEDAVKWVRYGIYQMMNSPEFEWLKKAVWAVAPGALPVLELFNRTGAIKPVEKPEERSFSDYQKIAADAATKSMEAGDSAAKKRLEEIGQRQKELDEEKRRRDEAIDEERKNRLEDMWESMAEDMAMEDFLDLLGAGAKAKAGVAGGKKTEEEKVSTGFVGIAEYAKQFQAAILKTEADRAAKETARNTARCADVLQEMEEQMGEGGVFGAT